MKVMPLYHVRHFKGLDVHTLGRFTSKENAMKLARVFIHGVQSSLEEEGVHSIIAVTEFTDPELGQDIRMMTLTDAACNPIGDHETLGEGVTVALIQSEVPYGSKPLQ